MARPIGGINTYVVLGTVCAFEVGTMQRTSPSFIRALVDDASFNPFFSSLLGLKRLRLASDQPVLERRDRAPLRLIEPAEQIRERAA